MTKSLKKVNSLKKGLKKVKFYSKKYSKKLEITQKSKFTKNSRFTNKKTPQKRELLKKVSKKLRIYIFFTKLLS